MTSNEESPLTTERIASNRRGPMAVVLVAFALVALLIWKPWDLPTAAVPTSRPPVGGPTVTPTASPTAPLATPQIQPTPAPTPQVLVVALLPIPDLASYVRCEYKPSQDATDNLLTAFLVGPPNVRLAPGALGLDIRRVSWRAVIQVNSLSTLFSADWQTVGRSARHFGIAHLTDQIPFVSIHLSYKDLPIDATLVTHLVIRLEWFGPHKQLLGSRDVVATSYTDDVSVVPEGCHTHF